MRKYLTPLLIPILLLMCETLTATHNRAGEITYTQTGGLTIRATITTYTRTSSFAADRDSLEMFWGDGTKQFIKRSNGQGVELPNDIKLNYYIAEHTYPTRGSYKMSVVDPNRIAGILNIDFPNSVNIQFYIETTLTLLDPRFQGRNSSAVLLQPPIDYACVNQIFTHNPNAFDPDGDSIAYELITPFQDRDVPVPNYELPDRISPGPTNKISLNSITGDFVWNSPKLIGEFNITYLIKEYREGTLINSIIRDMQILVRSCPDLNRPPKIDGPEEICVVAGELIEFEVIATDPDSNEILEFSALGGPFNISDPAVFTKGFLLPISRSTAKFKWQTNCSHVSPAFYQIVVKVTDELNNQNSGLATLKTIRIKVVAPPPKNLSAELNDGMVTLSWDSPYDCDMAKNFLGFSVWRREESRPIAIDSCSPSLSSHYEKIIFLTKDKLNNRYTAKDLEIEPAKIYCYRVVGEMAQFTEAGNPYNRAQSIPSNEFCLRTSFLEPLITKVSVISTGQNNGSIEINWLAPESSRIDTLEYPSPYSIAVSQAASLAGPNFTEIQSFNYNHLSLIKDTIHIASSLNTESTPYSYQIAFGSGTNNIFKSIPASSVYLNAIGRDQKIDLQWQHKVPWSNSNYEIYRINQQGLDEFIGASTTQEFALAELINGEEHCFRIKSFGSYHLQGIPDPIINFSQISCATATESIAPCTPVLSLYTICDSPEIEESDVLFNRLEWSFTGTCKKASDLNMFKIYYSENIGSSPSLLETLHSSAFNYDHVLREYITGCYQISAIDSSGNESSLSNRVCIKNCPNYSLPNSFTPNADGANDLFIPMINRFIESVNFKVFNRWGQKVFETNDPNINWNGTNMAGKELADGSYYYVCEVFERKVDGSLISNKVLNGSIYILR